MIALAPDETMGERQKALQLQLCIFRDRANPDEQSLGNVILEYCVFINLPQRRAACTMEHPTHTWFQDGDGNWWWNLCGPVLLFVIIRSDPNWEPLFSKEALERVLGWWQTDEPEPVFFVNLQSNDDFYDWVRSVHRWIDEGFWRRYEIAQADYPNEADHLEQHIKQYCSVLGSEFSPVHNGSKPFNPDSKLIADWLDAAKESLPAAKELRSLLASYLQPN
jgi:hypothetical protein